MIAKNLTEEQTAAVDVSLESYRSMLQQFSSDPRFMKDFDTALLGYSYLGERLAADAIFKLDYVLHPKLDAMAEGDELHLDGVTFSHIKRENGLSATAIDNDGIQRFRINWVPDTRPSLAGPDGERLMFNVTIQSCPPDRPQYPYADGIAYAHVSRHVNRIESTCRGTLWGHNFFEFVDAMDLLRPALAAEIAAMPRPKPISDNVPYSFSEMDRLMVADVVRLDGGLAGHLTRHVVAVMLEERGRAILESLASRAEKLAIWLENEGCVWGGTAMTANGRDNVLYAVRSEATGELGLLLNARNNRGPHTAFLAWTNSETGTASVAAAIGGKHIFQTVDAFIAGERPDAPTATIDLTTGEHDLGPEVVGTSILDLALCHVRFVEEDLEEIAAGVFEMDDRFERVEDFAFFVEANEDFYWDQETEDTASAQP